MLETPRIPHYSQRLETLWGDNVLGADNQQERPILSLEFLAGLIVGEGSYSLAIARGRKKKPHHREVMEIRPMFSLRMNDLETIDQVQEAFLAYELDIYRNPNLYARCANLSVTGVARMRKHLDVFLPLLTGKKLQAAAVVSEFCNRRLTDAFHKRYTEDDVMLIERLRTINGPSAVRLDLGILRDYVWRTNGRAPAVKR